MDLATATAEIYRVFGAYPRRPRIDACTHCVDHEDHARLRRAPLRELSASDLDRYAFKAMTTWGDELDYKHFLPRILELAASAEGRGHFGFDLDLIAGKLTEAGLPDWPAPERAALAVYAAQLWVMVLAVEPEQWRAARLLPALARMVPSSSSLLERWSTDPSRTAALQLADLVSAHWSDIFRHGALRGPWNAHPAEHAVRSWLMEPARMAALEGAFERWGDDAADARRLADAADLMYCAPIVRSG
jgi:hypothetical protein